MEGKRHYKISLCTVNMNRLHHLEQTFARNLSENAAFSNIEFVLLDYNSKDAMADWVKDNFQSYIESGILCYYKTSEPPMFNYSHSRNLLFRLATGDIVCNIDADNFCGRGFAAYVERQFLQQSELVLTTIDEPRTRNNYFPPKDVIGRICVKKKDFQEVRGFDERIVEYGCEDYDFINRLEMKGLKRVLIEDMSYLTCVFHSNSERFNLQEKLVEKLYVCYLTPYSSKVLILYNNKQFLHYEISDNNRTENQICFSGKSDLQDKKVPFSLRLRKTGNWTEDRCFLNAVECNISNTQFIKSQNCLIDINGDKYFEVNSKKVKYQVLLYNFLHQNLSILQENLETRNIVVNPSGFGRATVYKNFSSERICYE